MLVPKTYLSTINKVLIYTSVIRQIFAYWLVCSIDSNWMAFGCIVLNIDIHAKTQTLKFLNRNRLWAVCWETTSATTFSLLFNETYSNLFCGMMIIRLITKSNVNSLQWYQLTSWRANYLMTYWSEAKKKLCSKYYAIVWHRADVIDEKTIITRTPVQKQRQRVFAVLPVH